MGKRCKKYCIDSKSAFAVDVFWKVFNLYEWVRFLYFILYFRCIV